MTEQHFSAEELMALADLLMGAASADGVVQAEETRLIRNLLALLLEGNALPPELDEYLEQFDPAAFDLAACCAALDTSTRAKRRNILGLVARVTEVDKVHDLDESAYIVQVAKAIKALPGEYQSLVVDFSAGVEEMPAAPPPPPRSATKGPPPPPPPKKTPPPPPGGKKE